MRAAVLTKANTPWEIKDVDEPKPGPGQVVIRVQASGMCWSDVLAHRGQRPVQLPTVPGHEPVGEIVEIGAGVMALHVGDRVGSPGIRRAVVSAYGASAEDRPTARHTTVG